MTTPFELAVAEKSEASRLEELTETGPITEDTVPTELSKTNVNRSPADRFNPELLVLDIESCALADAPARNSSGLMLKAALPLSAWPTALNIKIGDKRAPIQIAATNLLLRIQFPSF
jgi:hypothetical protein